MNEESELAKLAEAELVERFRSTAEDRYFAELYRRERRKVFGICLRFLHDPALAEEACHDSFVSAFEHFGTFEGTSFAAWICRIAAHRSLNLLRSRRTMERLALRATDVQEPEAEQLAMSSEQWAAAREILALLRDDQRKALLLRYVDGLSHQEIAVRIGCVDSAVRSLLQNGRRNFRLAWDRRWSEAGR